MGHAWLGAPFTITFTPLLVSDWAVGNQRVVVVAPAQVLLPDLCGGLFPVAAGCPNAVAGGSEARVDVPAFRSALH